MLDECDEMLNMGFVDDVEKILGAGGPRPPGAPRVQTLLFSATLPAWVKDITKRFLAPEHKVTRWWIGRVAAGSGSGLPHPPSRPPPALANHPVTPPPHSLCRRWTWWATKR